MSTIELKIDVKVAPSSGVPSILPIGSLKSYTIGLAESNFLHALENAVHGIPIGETMLFQCDSRNFADDVPFNFPINLIDESKLNDEEDVLAFTVCITDIAYGKNLQELSPEEKLHLAGKLKEAGTDCFRLKKHDLAFHHYSRALKYCYCVKVCADENVDVTELAKIFSQCYFNMAACHMARDSPQEVVYCCTKGLAADPQNVKGLYRRSQAFQSLQLIDEALSDAKEAIEVDPKNKAIMKQVSVLKEAKRSADAGIAHAMTKYFG
jgi:tetratricopeptide (TPR) repeat protein